MTKLTLLLTLAFANPAEAHCYSIWHYPWKQRCPVQRVAQIEAPAPPAKPVDWPPLFDKPDIPLPSLKDMEFPPDCDADWCERLKGIGMLREKFGTN